MNFNTTGNIPSLHVTRTSPSPQDSLALLLDTYQNPPMNTSTVFAGLRNYNQTANPTYTTFKSSIVEQFHKEFQRAFKSQSELELKSRGNVHLTAVVQFDNEKGLIQYDFRLYTDIGFLKEEAEFLPWVVDYIYNMYPTPYSYKQMFDTFEPTWTKIVTHQRTESILSLNYESFLENFKVVSFSQNLSCYALPGYTKFVAGHNFHQITQLELAGPEHRAILQAYLVDPKDLLVRVNQLPQPNPLPCPCIDSHALPLVADIEVNLGRHEVNVYDQALDFILSVFSL